MVFLYSSVNSPLDHQASETSEAADVLMECRRSGALPAQTLDHAALANVTIADNQDFNLSLQLRAVIIGYCNEALPVVVFASQDSPQNRLLAFWPTVTTASRTMYKLQLQICNLIKRPRCQGTVAVPSPADC